MAVNYIQQYIHVYIYMLFYGRDSVISILLIIDYINVMCVIISVLTEDQSYAAYHTHEYENGVNPSVTNSRNGYITESSDNYQIEHIADPTDNRFLDNRIGSQGVHGAECLSDSDYNKNLYNYSDPPPSYYEATKTSNITETTI